MIKRWNYFGYVIICFIFLTGCMYPNDARPGYQSSPRETVAIVQSAVDQYFSDRQILPIKNFESDTPYYERYVVDLRKLTLEGYIGQLPAAAFEQGGSYYFVIVDPEEQRVVKMLDLVVVQKVGDVQREVDDYRRNHQGNIPAGEAISPNWYLIDYDKLKLDPVEFISPYSQQKISLMIHKDGQVAVDYAAEIMKMMQQHSIEQPEVSDLREYLVEYTYFVPAASVPYLWQDDMPVAQP